MSVEGTTILLAEDEPLLAEMYRDFLIREGYNVVHATNGEQALQLINEVHPSLIIMDIMMPKMNGLDVARSVRKTPDTAAIPIIIVTALVNQIEPLRQLLGPRDAYLIKSEVLPTDIIAVVKKLLGQDAVSTEATPSLGITSQPTDTPPAPAPAPAPQPKTD
jgi:CheY-like chemotaxis protein